MADDGADASAESVRRGRTARRALALAPLLPLTAAWTLVLSDPAATPGAGVALLPLAVSQPAAAATTTTFPEVTTISAPPTAGGSSTLTSTATDRAPTVVDDIPDVALAAYQRAATVANAADQSCHISWQLLAAVGRVESNHGRFGGSQLDADGVATPAIIGPRLDGRHGTSKITDTDAGELDGDPKFDRAVGPMQFIPATWSYVGVDADGDGVRNPQDIDDAALGAGVYLCAGGEDLATEAGQRHAVHRYNHSSSYVDLVLTIMRSYQRDDLWTIPGSGIGGIAVLPARNPVPSPPPVPQPPPQLGSELIDPVVVHSDPPTPEPDPADPIDPDPGPPTPTPTDDPTDDPTEDPTDDPFENAPANPAPDPGGSPASEPSEPASSEPSESAFNDPAGSSSSDPGEPPPSDAGEPPSSDPAESPFSDPAGSPTPSSDASPDPSPDPAPEPDPAPAPAPPAELAAALCAEVGYADDAACLDAALAGSDAPEWVLPTADQLLGRLEEPAAR